MNQKVEETTTGSVALAERVAVLEKQIGDLKGQLSTQGGSLQQRPETTGQNVVVVADDVMSAQLQSGAAEEVKNVKSWAAETFAEMDTKLKAVLARVTDDALLIEQLQVSQAVNDNEAIYAELSRIEKQFTGGSNNCFACDSFSPSPVIKVTPSCIQ